MRKCSEEEGECPAICDFCRHFDTDRRSTEDGYCSEHDEDKCIEESCDDFYCVNAD